MSPQSDSSGSSPGFLARLGRFLGRLLTAFLKLGLAAIVLAILAGVAWLIYREIDRSFDSVVSRVEANARRIELTEDDVGRYLATNEAQRGEVQELQAAIATREATIAALETSVAAGQARQDTDLADLEGQFADLVARSDAITTSIAFLSEGLVTLQGDTTASLSEIDALGGAVDAVQAEVIGQGEEIAAVQNEIGAFSAEEFARMQQALALFRMWEMVSRARFRLLEQNVGLASADIGVALETADSLLLVAPAETATAISLEEVRQRLIQASSGLPDDPAAAARDLETAWEALDAILARLLGAETIQPSANAPLSPTPTATPTP
jgi:chromosome segregation ATPase